jgi:2-dehydropantoate 2-reductase
VKIGILGAGAIGCYLGGRLRASGVEVVFLARSTAHELKTHGLHITSLDGFDRTLAPSELTVATTAEALRGCDVVLITVKGGATVEAARQLLAADPPLVVSFQNGVRNPELLRAELGPRALAGMVQFNVLRRNESGYHQATTGTLVVEDDPRARPLVDALVRAGLLAHLAPDMRAVLWGKLLLNLNNSINALAGVPLVEEIAQRDYRRVLADCQAEALAALGRARIRPDLGVSLPAWIMPTLLRLPNPLFRAVAGRLVRMDPTARSSMWEDLDRNRPTEIDALNGEVVRLAASVGLPAPVNQAIAGLVRAAEGHGSPGLSAVELRRRIQSAMLRT